MTSASSQPSTDRLTSQQTLSRALLILILLVGIFVRVMSLQGESFWEDEAQSFYQARNPFFLAGDNPFGIKDIQDRFVFLRYILENDIHPPFYYAQLGLWSLLGISDWFLRSNSILWGMLTIVAVYYLANQLPGSKSIPLIAASLIAIAPFHVEMSIELRMYSLFAFLAVVSIIALHHILHQPAPRKRLWLGFTLINICIIYSQGIGFLWLVILNLIYLGVIANHWLRTRQLPPTLKGWFLTQIITVGAFAPWLILKLRGGFGGVSSVAKYLKVPTISELLGTPGQLLFNNVVSNDSTVSALSTPPGLLSLLSLFLIPLLAIALYTLRKDVTNLLLLTVPSLGSLLIFYLLSVLARPVFIIRALIFCLPFFAILIAIGLVTLSQIINQALSKKTSLAANGLPGNYVLSILLIGMIAVNFWGVYQGISTPNRKQWREVGAAVAQQIQPQDVIVIPRSTMGSFILYSPPINRQNYNGLFIQQVRSPWVDKDFLQKTGSEYQALLQANQLDYGKKVGWVIVTSAVDPNALAANQRLAPRLWLIDSLNKGGATMDQLEDLVKKTKVQELERKFYMISATAYR